MEHLSDKSVKGTFCDKATGLSSYQCNFICQKGFGRNPGNCRLVYNKNKSNEMSVYSESVGEVLMWLL